MSMLLMTSLVKNVTVSENMFQVISRDLNILMQRTTGSGRNSIFIGEDVYEYDYTDFYPEGQLDYGNQEIGMDLYEKYYGQRYGSFL